MPVRTDVGNIVFLGLLGPASIATDTNTDSTAIDMASYPGYRVILRVRVGTRTDGTFTPALISSSDDAASDAYAAVTPQGGSVAAISAATTERVSYYQPTERYIKARITSASTTSGALCTAQIVLVPPAF